MRTGIFALFMLALLLLVQPARAQFINPADMQKSDLTPAITVAMLYYKYSHQAPDFQAWALLSDDYKNAADYDKLAMQDSKAKELEQSFSLLAPDEMIVADFDGVLSDYSLQNEGYIVENFTNTMFIPFSYAGENYAVVPKGAVDKQWLSVKGMAAKSIDDLRKASKSGKNVTLTLSLASRYANQDEKVTIDGKDYRLLAAEIKSIAVFDPKGAVLWRQQPDAISPISKQQQELLNLYK